MEGNPVNEIDPYGLSGNGVVGDPFNRPGPTDQSGRVPRTGSPVSRPPGGSVIKDPKVPPGETAKRVGLSEAIKRISYGTLKVNRKTGLLEFVPRPWIAITLLAHTDPLGCSSFDCNNNGIPDSQETQYECK